MVVIIQHNTKLSLIALLANQMAWLIIFCITNSGSISHFSIKCNPIFKIIVTKIIVFSELMLLNHSVIIEQCHKNSRKKPFAFLVGVAHLALCVQVLLLLKRFYEFIDSKISSMIIIYWFSLNLHVVDVVSPNLNEHTSLLSFVRNTCISYPSSS